MLTSLGGADPDETDPASSKTRTVTRLRLVIDDQVAASQPIG